MSERDGYAATRQARVAGYAGPMVAVTANAMSSDRARCLQAGCDDYLTKPIDQRTLLATCARWTRASRVVATSDVRVRRLQGR
ncbi:MAG: response regulator [Planctomycetota bacterium]